MTMRAEDEARAQPERGEANAARQHPDAQAASFDANAKPAPARPDAKTALRYTLFQLPGIALAIAFALAAIAWFAVPPHWAWSAVLLWTLKDAALFPFVWRAYTESARGGPHDMRGRTGTAVTVLAPRGWVTLGAERWRARCAPGEAPLPKGARVRVVEIVGLELRVAPAEE